MATFFKAILQRIRAAWPVPGASPFHGFHSAGQLRAVLQRERARADRSGEEFSLLSLGVKDEKLGRPTLLYLAKALRRRLRATDEVGWLDDRHLGVVLPGTPAWGAWTVADDLCTGFPARVPLPECKVYTYPSTPADGQPEEAEPVRPTRRSAERKKRTHAMEILFCRPLPLWKRAMDLAGAGLGLLVLLPLFAVVAVLIKLTSRGPVFFAQKRYGLGGRPFTMYKFRSMVADAEMQLEKLQALNERDGPVFKIRKDPRTTAIGRFLRITSIDELPQLWNVLRGEMSLVGPRPPLGNEVLEYRTWQRRRLEVTPGLTCIWQVRGRSAVPFVEWMRMDLRYIRSLSLVQDLRLLLETIPAVVSRKGAS